MDIISSSRAKNGSVFIAQNCSDGYTQVKPEDLEMLNLLY